MDTIRFYLLKNPQVFWGEKEIFQELHTKAKALLFYLAMNKKQSFSRDQLSEMFWPEQSNDNSRANLRQALSAIRRAAADAELATELLLTEKGFCALRDPQTIWVDALVFNEIIGQAEVTVVAAEKSRFLQKAVDLYHRGFLTGFHVKGSSSTEEWLLFERESLSQTFARACLTLADLYEASSAEDQAIACLLKLLKTNPLQEEVHCRLMVLYDRKGLRYKAIEQYRQCAGLLRSELNLSPMEETEALYQQILQAESLPPSPPAALGRERTTHSATAANASAQLTGHHLFLLETETEVRLRLLVADLAPHGEAPLVLAEALAEIDPLDYTGYYQLLTTLDNAMGQAAPTPSCLADSPTPGRLAQILREPLEAGKIHAFWRLLEQIADTRTVVLCFRGFEALDEPTKRLAQYLLHHCRHPAVHLLLTFRKREALNELLEKLNQLPNPFGAEC